MSPTCLDTLGNASFLICPPAWGVCREPCTSVPGDPSEHCREALRGGQGPGQPQCPVPASVLASHPRASLSAGLTEASSQDAGKAGRHWGAGCWTCCPDLMVAWEGFARVGAGGCLCGDACVDVLTVPACPTLSLLWSWKLRRTQAHVLDFVRDGPTWPGREAEPRHRCARRGTLRACVGRVGPAGWSGSWSQCPAVTSVRVPRQQWPCPEEAVVRAVPS